MKQEGKYVALYERLSRDDELNGESNSISHQKELLEEYARSHGIRNYRHFTDDGFSGLRFDRPSFKLMMEEAKDGHISMVVAKDMSRYGRDYLMVGQILEMFRQKGVMVVAVNDGVDTSKGDDDFIPFRNLMNEWYAKDISKKIRSVVQTKGRSGKHVATTPPYGYLKSKDDPNQWIVDEEAAKVIRRIYQMTIDGLGPYQIACILKEEKVLMPAAYMSKCGVGTYQGRVFPDPYNWSATTVGHLLEHEEYRGCTINFKTKKHLKDHRSVYVDRDLWLIFENTQEPIIDKETYELVRKIRNNVTRWPNGWGPAHPLNGLVFCADCGGKLYCHRTSNCKPNGKYSCSGFPKKKCKSGHRIDAKDLLTAVGKALKAVHDYIQVDSNQFIKTVKESINSQQTQDVKAQKKRLAECQQRSQELETLICKIYEDNILGKLSDKRYQIMSDQYETENKAVEQEIIELTNEINRYVDGSSEARKFMNLINKYQNFDDLTPGMINELIDKVVVYERDKKYCRQTTQRVDIYFSFIGEFPPNNEYVVNSEPDAVSEEERQKIEERKERLRKNYQNRKANGKQRAYYEAYKPRNEARKAELRAKLEIPCMSVSEYYRMRKEMRTPNDIPEGLIGYDAEELVRKAKTINDKNDD